MARTRLGVWAGVVVLGAAGGAGVLALQNRQRAQDEEKSRLALERLAAEAAASTGTSASAVKRPWTQDAAEASVLSFTTGREFCAAVLPRPGPDLARGQLASTVEAMLRSTLRWEYLFCWDHVDKITVALPLRQPMTQTDPLLQPSHPQDEELRVWVFGQPAQNLSVLRKARIRQSFWSDRVLSIEWIETWQRPAIQYPNAV